MSLQHWNLYTNRITRFCFFFLPPRHLKSCSDVSLWSLTKGLTWGGEGMAYLLWPQLHLCDPRGVHHGFGPAQVLYQALPLCGQAHEAPPLGVEGRVHAVLEVLGRRYFGPLLFLFAEHPQVHRGDSLPPLKRPCGEKHSAFHKLRSADASSSSNCHHDIWI